MGDVDEGTRVRWLLYRVCIVVGRDSMYLRRDDSSCIGSMRNSRVCADQLNIPKHQHFDQWIVGCADWPS